MTTFWNRNLGLGACLGLILSANACGPAGDPTSAGNPSLADDQSAALGETLQTTPTAWWWYYGQTAAQVSALINAHNARIVSLQVEQAAPELFTVALVQNAGVYAKSWWWYYGLTASQLSSTASSLGARIVNLEAYVVRGQTLFAAVLIKNSGADAKGWWWYYGLTIDQVGSYLRQNGARLVDLDSYDTSSGKRFAAVMIPNSGADARAWWYYDNVSGAQVAALVQQNGATLTDIEPYDVASGTYNVIMERQPGIEWWWYYGLTEAQLNDRVAQNGARIFNVESFNAGGTKYFAAIMVNNSNAATTRVGNILRSDTDGASGLYLKALDGPVLAALQADRVFEPASSIKIIVAYHAMKQVDLGNASLDQQVIMYAATPGSSCPSDTITGTEPMSNAILQMLEVSDNQRTKALINTFGMAAIDQTAHSIGMASTNLNHYPGCGGPPANQLTLIDAGHVYEGIADGTLLSTSSRLALYARMPSDAGDFTGVEFSANQIVDQEAAALGLSTSQAAAYKSALDTHEKAGGYTLCPNGTCLEYRSVAGSAYIPTCTRGQIGTQIYLFGMFVDGATSKAGADKAFGDTRAELLREPIRAALTTWGGCAN